MFDHITIDKLINLYYYFIADCTAEKMNKSLDKNMEECLIYSFKGEDFVREIITK